jgi:alcohol dehydrogenase class IV
MSKIEAADASIEAIVRISPDLKIFDNIRVLGVKEEDIRFMAQNAMKDISATTNP